MILDLEYLSPKMLFTNPRAFWRELSSFFHRAVHGYGSIDTYDMDYYFVKTYLPFLKEFKRVNIAYPCNMTYEEWNAIIDTMIDGFEAKSKLMDDGWDMEIADIKTLQKRSDKSMKLFIKHLDSLWW